LWDLPQFSWQAVSRESFIALVGLTVFATIGAFLCYNYALTRIPAGRAAVCINGIPLVTACGAWLLLGESLTKVQLVGGAVVLVAVFLANCPSQSTSMEEVVKEV
jgi:drug/metabolite transporter (DMT)-like permease